MADDAGAVGTGSVPGSPSHYIPPGQLSMIQKKQALEEARKARILNAKVRTIGVDVNALDEQVAAKKAKEESSKQAARVVEENILAVDNQLKVLEIERHRMHIEATKDTVDFNSRYLQKSDRREYDLSDPHRLRKDRLPREDELGVSSITRFAGEDPNMKDRRKAQMAQQRQWMAGDPQLQQQVFEKESAKEGVAMERAEFAKSQQAMIALRQQLEEEEASIRKQITTSALEYNETQRKILAERRKETKPLSERILDAQEMRAQADSELLNETTHQYNQNGRIRRDHFRGLSREYYVESAKQNANAVDVKKAAEEHMNMDGASYDTMVEANRRALVAVEKERLETYREIVENEMRKNVMPTLEEKKNMGKPSRGLVTEDFFKGFGTSTR